MLDASLSVGLRDLRLVQLHEGKLSRLQVARHSGRSPFRNIGKGNLVGHIIVFALGLPYGIMSARRPHACKRMQRLLDVSVHKLV